MSKALVIGGSNGIGLAIAMCLRESYKVVIIDKSPLDTNLGDNVVFEQFDLTSDDYSIFNHHQDATFVMVTAGFGHLALFKDIEEDIISKYFNVNTIPAIRIVKHFYEKLMGSEDFYFGIMVSIAGFMSSPFFSVYGATKAALKVFIESVNVELEKSGSTNKILNVSPGSIKGTKFNDNTQNNLQETLPLAKEIIKHIQEKKDLFIPQYENIYHEVLERYHADFRQEGLHSYDYKVNSGRIKTQKQTKP